VVVWCNYLNTNLSTMKKLSVFASLSLMLSSLSWAGYEYVRLTPNDSAITLNSGDIAHFIDGGNANYYDGDGNVLAESMNRITVGGTRNIAAVNAIFIGPSTVSCSDNSDYITLKIERASQTGSKTLEWDGSKYAGGVIQNSNNNNDNSSPVPDASGIKYDSLLGWCYFTDTPWFYSYTNGSWYYMHSMQDGIYVWNANLPNDGWMKLHG